MKPRSFVRRTAVLPRAVGLLAVAGCSSGSSGGSAAAPAPNSSTARPNPDPRVGLAAGTTRVIEGTNRRTVATPAARHFIRPGREKENR